MQEIETTLMQSARSTKGLIEAARILSTLKKANSQSQSNSAHASNAAFVNGIAQNAKQRVQESSDRHQAGSDRHTGTANHRQKAGTCTACIGLYRITPLLAYYIDESHVPHVVIILLCSECHAITAPVTTARVAQ